MASSKGQAIHLKDAYVKGIIDSGLAQQEQLIAGRLIDLPSRKTYSVNDGNDRLVITDGDDMSVTMGAPAFLGPNLNNGNSINNPTSFVQGGWVNDVEEEAAKEFMQGRYGNLQPNTVRGEHTHDQYRDAMTKPYQ